MIGQIIPIRKVLGANRDQSGKLGIRVRIPSHYQSHETAIIKFDDIVLFNHFIPNGFFLLVCYNKLGMVHCIYQGVTGYNFQIKIVFLSLMIVLVLGNSADPDEMLQYASFHLGLHCLSKKAFLSQ